MSDRSGNAVDATAGYAGESTYDATRDYEAARARGEVQVAQAGGSSDGDDPDLIGLPANPDLSPGIQIIDPSTGRIRNLTDEVDPSKFNSISPGPMGRWGSGHVVNGPQINRVPNEKISSPPSRRGNAPIGDDGHPIEIHHDQQKPNAPKEEMTRTDHRLGENFSRNHSNTGQKPSQIDRKDFARERRDHWSREWDNGRFKGLSDDE